MKVYYTGEKNGVPTITFRKNEKHINETINTFKDVVDKIEKKNLKVNAVI